MKKEEKKFPSELRHDLISGDWVLIATGRAKRPEAFAESEKEKIDIPKEKCPFCNIETQEKPNLIFSKGKIVSELENWTTVVIPNKYPALLPAKKIEKTKEGKFYQKISGVGFCELVITRDHYRHFANFKIEEVKEVFDAYQQRYLSLKKQPFVKYISIFHNHGKKAGASQPHPHSQIFTTPLLDIDLKKALLTSEKYFRKFKKCIYCEMNKWEIKAKKRVVFENKDFLVLCPFASKTAFEIIISPKKHSSNFEDIDEKQKWSLAEGFLIAMKKLFKALNNPSYNFYLHTSPCDKRYSYYHWHLTILPKTAIPAGFELGTRIEISTIEPEKAAEYLRFQKL